MGTVLISAVQGVCLLAALGAAGLWVRSYSTIDEYDWRVRPKGNSPSLVYARAVTTTPGRLVFYERSVFT